MKTESKWPKIFPALTPEQAKISDDFVRHWHVVLAESKKFNLLENFNQGYSVKQSDSFLSTLEVGAGLGEHLNYENLTAQQRQNYVALELRDNMADRIRQKFPDITVCVSDCQERIPYPARYFDRIIATHVLEHLPNLPAAVKELYRICQPKGYLLVVIPCEGGHLYSLARKFSAERIFKKRYKQSYRWFIEREHVNTPYEIKEELSVYFEIIHQQYFPFYLPSIHANLCIGLKLRPKTFKKAKDK